MNYREKMKEYLKEPDEYSSQYGKWGILNKEQRNLIKRLLKEMDSADTVIKDQCEEIERLINIINELDNWLGEKILSWEDNGNVSDNIYHERLAIQTVYFKLQELKGSDSNE